MSLIKKAYEAFVPPVHTCIDIIMRIEDIMIKHIDLKDPEILEQIFQLQRASYQVEAKIIGFNGIPPLLETREQLKECSESFYGYYVNGTLAGILSYQLQEQLLDICRLAVHPDYFRKGIAGALLEQALLSPDYHKAIVSTGQKNLPAVLLYQKHGFQKIRDVEVITGIYLTEFEYIR